MGALQAPCFLLSFFCLLVLLPFCLLVIFVFFPFCLFVTTIITTGSISTTTQIFVPICQFFHFTTHFTANHYHYCHPPPLTFYVPKRNTGKCFERPAKILRGRQRFGNNLGGGGGAGVLTIWFYVSDIINPTNNFLRIPDNLFLLILIFESTEHKLNMPLFEHVTNFEFLMVRF